MFGVPVFDIVVPVFKVTVILSVPVSALLAVAVDTYVVEPSDKVTSQVHASEALSNVPSTATPVSPGTVTLSIVPTGAVAVPPNWKEALETVWLFVVEITFEGSVEANAVPAVYSINPAVVGSSVGEIAKEYSAVSS